MRRAGFERRLLRELGRHDEGVLSPALSFATDVALLLARYAPESPDESTREAMASATIRRAGITDKEADALLRLALAPENRWEVSEAEHRAFSGRFGNVEGTRLRAELSGEITLESFASAHGTEHAMLLLDAMHYVAAADGHIDREEQFLLQRAARELGIDPAFGAALYRKHDERHTAGTLRFSLTGDRVDIGRAPTSAVPLPDPLVAMHHAELIRAGDGWRVVDLDSGRPTLLNDQPVHAAPIQAEDRIRVGGYTLSIEAGGAELVATATSRFSTLSVRGLCRHIGDVQLLDNVSFTAFSGEVVAIVGPSGSGKTTLLNAIAGVAPASTGEVQFDGRDFHRLLLDDPSLVGLVPQDDIVHAELSVTESLDYSGKLRFGPTVSPSALRGEVDRVLQELALEPIRDARIGDAARRGISGGQRKRVNLGQELLTRSTRLLFLDEPTSGLDPQTSQDIVSRIRALADQGRIVFLVTHDLSPSILSMVDHLLVLAEGGRVAWFGPPAGAAAHFGVGSPDELFRRLPQQPAHDWQRRFHESEAHRTYVRTREHIAGAVDAAPNTADSKSPVPHSGWDQYTTLTSRTLRTKVRDTGSMLVTFAQAPLLALAMILVFPKADTGTLFMLVLSALWFGASSSVRDLIGERAIWKREARVGVRTAPYLAAKVTVLGALVSIQCVVLTTLCFVALGMGANGDPALGYSWMGMCEVTILTGWVGVALGLLLSASFTTSEAAIAALPLVLIPQIAFGGLVVKVKQMSLAATLVSNLMVTRFAFDALIKTGDQLWVPSVGYQAREPLPILGVLSDLGFRTAGSPVTEIGLTDHQLTWILLGFFVAFLTPTAWLVHRTGRNA